MFLLGFPITYEDFITFADLIPSSKEDDGEDAFVHLYAGILSNNLHDIMVEIFRFNEENRLMKRFRKENGLPNWGPSWRENSHYFEPEKEYVNNAMKDWKCEVKIPEWYLHVRVHALEETDIHDVIGFEIRDLDHYNDVVKRYDEYRDSLLTYFNLDDDNGFGSIWKVQEE